MSAQNARLDMRLRPEHKDLIEQAAAITGQTVTAFAMSALLEKAQQVLEREVFYTFSSRDRERFLQIVDRQEPCPKLQEAGAASLARLDGRRWEIQRLSPHHQREAF